MKIKGEISIWFNASSYFSMKFNDVSIPEALDMLKLIQDALHSVEEPTVKDEPDHGEEKHEL